MASSENLDLNIRVKPRGVLVAAREACKRALQETAPRIAAVLGIEAKALQDAIRTVLPDVARLADDEVLDIYTAPKTVQGEPSDADMEQFFDMMERRLVKNRGRGSLGEAPLTNVSHGFAAVDDLRRKIASKNPAGAYQQAADVAVWAFLIGVAQRRLVEGDQK